MEEPLRGVKPRIGPLPLPCSLTYHRYACPVLQESLQAKVRTILLHSSPLFDHQGLVDGIIQTSSPTHLAKFSFSFNKSL